MRDRAIFGTFFAENFSGRWDLERSRAISISVRLSTFMFNFESIPKLDERARVASHARMREKADSNVQAALDAKTARDSELFDSAKHIVRAEEKYQKAKSEFPLLKGKKLLRSRWRC